MLIGIIITTEQLLNCKMAMAQLFSSENVVIQFKFLSYFYAFTQCERISITKIQGCLQKKRKTEPVKYESSKNMLIKNFHSIFAIKKWIKIKKGNN